VEHILEATQETHPTWRMNKTTVYRTLDLLQRLGLIYEMRHADGRAQYEPAVHGPHGHLLCSVCGKVQDIDLDLAAALRQGLLARQGFDLDLANHALAGLCAHCASLARA
jgi:Fur family ferric uptake transcriptional regulator